MVPQGSHACEESGAGVMRKRTFLVVEDDAAFLRSLRRLISNYGNATCVGTVRDALAALESRTDWSALIADLFLRDGSGLDVLAKFRSRQATASAMILTGHVDPTAINVAYDLEADYVVKPIDSARMHRFLQPSMVGLAALSQREREVLGRLSLGHETKIIASDLDLADSTVRTLLERMKAKLGVHSRAELLEKAAATFQPSAEDFPGRKY
jgi:DNA-binding NarL/FixJ family response regulator